jgi:predicted O-methyltransferase YrrM
MEIVPVGRWTLDVLKKIRPRHIVQSVLRPKRAIRELKYRYTFTSTLNFPISLLGVTRVEVVRLFDELENDTQFVSSIYENLKASPPSPGSRAMTHEAELLYVVTRIIKPSIFVETGVGAGKSSAFILRAMEKNEKGVLYSVDLPDEHTQSGWIVPHKLKSRWDLRLGSSEELLRSLLLEIGPIDVFFHDSDHSYENMMFEFRSAWPFLKRNGLFLAHDVGRNDALFDFCSEVKVPWTQIKTFHVLAGFRKRAEGPLNPS